MKSATVKHKKVNAKKVVDNYIEMLKMLDNLDDSRTFFRHLDMTDPLMLDALNSVYPPLD